MSQLHAELTEQAAELGFESIEQAEACGYEVIGTDGWAKLVPRDPLEEMSEAHKAWLEERDDVIKDLDHIALGYAEAGFDDHAEKLYKAIDFIKRGEV